MSSENIKALTNQYIMNSYGRYDVALDHGENARLYDPEGHEYIDFTSGIGVSCLGAGNQAVMDAAMADEKLTHTSNLSRPRQPPTWRSACASGRRRRRSSCNGAVMPRGRSSGPQVQF